MKAIILSAAVVITSITSCDAQYVSQSAIPSVVTNAFAKQFPKANDVDWEKKGDLYEVEFETGLTNREHEILMDAGGKLVYHKQDIDESELPQAVKESVVKEFAGFSVGEIEKIESEGATTYEVEVKKSPEEWDVVFSADGKILEKKPD